MSRGSIHIVNKDIYSLLPRAKRRSISCPCTQRSLGSYSNISPGLVQVAGLRSDHALGYDDLDCRAQHIMQQEEGWRDTDRRPEAPTIRSGTVGADGETRGASGNHWPNTMGR